jgi:hypothetical protein
MNEYREIEERIMETICKKFGLNPDMPQHPDLELVKKLSRFPITLFRIIPISWREAEQRFFQRFKEPIR